MKRQLSAVFGITAAIIAFGFLAPSPARAGVNINIGVNLPGLVFPGPPGLVVIPGSYVYYPPDADVDVFFYHGYWYRPYAGGWYIAGGYNGPWRVIAPARVPRPLFNLPPGYRTVPPRYGRMPYREVRSNWRTWENERRWENGGRERGERTEHGDRGYGHGRGRGW